MKSRRKAHYRTNKYGTTYFVAEHDFNRSIRLIWRGGRAYVGRSQIWKMKCLHCGKAVFFYRNDQGSRVFFDEIGHPWPKHGCMDRKGKLQRVPMSETEPVIRDRSEPDAQSDAKKKTQRPVKVPKEPNLSRRERLERLRRGGGRLVR